MYKKQYIWKFPDFAWGDQTLLDTMILFLGHKKKAWIKWKYGFLEGTIVELPKNRSPPDTEPRHFPSEGGFEAVSEIDLIKVFSWAQEFYTRIIMIIKDEYQQLGVSQKC